MLSELSLKVLFKQFKSDKTMLCKHTRSLSSTTTYSNCNIKDSLLQKHNKNHPSSSLLWSKQMSTVNFSKHPNFFNLGFPSKVKPPAREI